MTAGAVAAALLDGTEAGRATVVPGFGTKAIRWAAGTTPGLLASYADAKIAHARTKRLGVLTTGARPR